MEWARASWLVRIGGARGIKCIKTVLKVLRAITAALIPVGHQVREVVSPRAIPRPTAPIVGQRLILKVGALLIGRLKVRVGRVQIGIVGCAVGVIALARVAGAARAKVVAAVVGRVVVHHGKRVSHACVIASIF
jgi:hypothetical protein